MNKEEIEFIEGYEDLLNKGYCDCNEMNCLGYNSPKEILRIVKKLQQENKQLKEQLDYIRSGEYYNQLRFERDMLQDLVEKGEIPKEDKEFIDCTHRNTELLEKNKQLKEKYNKTLKIFEKTEILPCECFEEYFDFCECDYCNDYCSNADIKCWDNFIENFDLKGEDNE